MSEDRAPTSPSHGATFVLVATVLFAFKGILARLVLATGMSVVAVVSLRVLLATPLYLGVGALLVRRRGSPPAPLGARVEAMLTGAFFLFAAACDFSAIHRIGAGPSRVILFSFPGFVLLIEAARTRTRPRAAELVTFALAWLGLVGVAAPDGLRTLADRDLSGVFFALGGAVAYAIFVTASQRSMRSLGAVRFTMYSNVGTCALLVVALPFVASRADFVLDVEGLGWLTLMVALCTVLPFFLLSQGIERAGAGPASLLTLVGPPITVVAAYVLLGELLTPIQVAGAALVVGSISWLKARDALRARAVAARTASGARGAASPAETSVGNAPTNAGSPASAGSL
ncbi:MAG: DMT family transporter [Polyangiales bacterium]|nr:EamA family transporter [Sandaracinaceae bacterium]